MKKIIFMGTGAFASIILEKLINSDFKPEAIITQEEKPKGRKQELSPSPAKEVAAKYDLPVYEPSSLVKDEGINLMKKLNPELIIVADYGKIIPKNILDFPKYKTLNVHPSLLPKYRGPSPLQNTILNGDKIAGTTIMVLDEEMDHGPIVKQKQVELKEKLTTKELLDKLANLSSDLLIKILPDYLSSKIEPAEQDHSKATYTKLVKKEDGKIDWNNSAIEIDQRIRAFCEWPAAWCEWKNKGKIYKIKILKSEVLKDSASNKQPGQVLLSENKEIKVQCGKNSLAIKELQLEGKKKTTGKEFLRGYHDIIDSILS